MKKNILIGLIVISLFILIGGSYKPLIYKIFNDYEEVCVEYQQRVLAIPQCAINYPQSDLIIDMRDCLEGEHPHIWSFNNETAYRHEYINTDVCLEYALRRRTNDTKSIYDFDWCEVYPDSEDCK